MGQKSYIYNNSNVKMMFQTSVSHSNSETFLQTVLKSRKHSRLNFRSEKQTLVLIQFMVIDFDKFSC